jgi:hypothetical protein
MNRLLVSVVFGLALAVSACGKKDEGVSPAASSESVGDQVNE